MYEQFTEQFQSSLKPVAALVAINLKTVESLIEQQSKFFTSTLNDTLAFTQDISSQKDITSILKVQQEYSADFQDKLISAGKDVYELMKESQEKKTEFYKSIFAQGQELASTMSAPIQSPAKPAASRTTSKSASK